MKNKTKIAQFDVDVMNTFSPVCPSELPVEGALDIVTPLNHLATLVDLRIGSKDAHQKNAEWVTEYPEQIATETGQQQAPHFWPQHAIPGTLGFELIHGMPEVEDYDHFVWKGIESNLHPYGACYHDPLHKISSGVIEYLAYNNVTDVIVNGLAYDFCVASTAEELAETKLFKVIMIRECSKGINPDNFKSIEEKLSAMGVIFFDTVSQYEKSL